MELQLRHNRSLADKQGPEYEAWLLACAEALVPRWQAAIDQGAALKGGGTSDPSAAPRTP